MTARPTSVTIAVVLTWISAAIAFIGGVAYLMNIETIVKASGLSGPVLRGTGAGLVILGLVMAFAAIRLGKGGSVMRVLVTVVMILRGIAGVMELINGSTPTQSTGAGSVILSIAIIGLLWNSKANAFFKNN